MLNILATNGPKMGQKHIFNILCPFCFILNKKKIEKKIENIKNLGQKWPKNGPKMGQKHIFNILCPFCFILNNNKIDKKKLKILQIWAKNGPKMDLLTFCVHFVSF